MTNCRTLRLRITSRVIVGPFCLEDRFPIHNDTVASFFQNSVDSFLSSGTEQTKKPVQHSDFKTRSLAASCTAAPPGGSAAPCVPPFQTPLA